MKKWESPAIDVLEIASTAWSVPDGEVLDGMYEDCYELYYS